MVRPRILRAVIVSCLCFCLAHGKRLEGRVMLPARRGLVLTKFCFDFNPACKSVEGSPKVDCAGSQTPGHVALHISDATRPISLDVASRHNAPATTGAVPEIYFTRMDDEYFSFPKISGVWERAHCEDMLKVSKKSYKMDWHRISSGTGEDMSTSINQHLRPRWWYIGLVSCSDVDVELTYSLHLTNPLFGAEQEFSVDAIGVLELASALTIAFGVLFLVQACTMMDWQGGRCAGHIHPAQGFVFAAVTLALISEASWVAYYVYMRSYGMADAPFDVVARVCGVASKAFMRTLLLLQARGQCVSSPHISWREHTPLLIGQGAVGCLSALLEVWGDSEFWGTSTEFVYDTRPGVALTAFDCLWLWLYVSWTWQTYHCETRAKPRHFYRTFGPFFAIWFAALPIVAVVAGILSPWVRFRIVFTASQLAHAVGLAVLIHTFRPSVATGLYDLKRLEKEAACSEELDSLLGSGRGL